ncbi:glycosyltransferase involved in cell wall biosynthesis [Anoxybacillus voinovskiensis]|uniref:Glycosyltransferase involved in cell wall biosynthesis n=1 Tax=Anoxybacteroides voinovskiense TaxID=230470 RepID=A0A840DQC0_9BACL|nr:glycosyltransferase family 4 protein [Anoxybacillus voinovskiensis]MBB4073805.1 glycosyltransferase involved in cell wall biosynthesis [Anoxybacillus voinovskiensis]GGJ63762.1 glycosyltransferase WbuB [Anoxybacillus voinovskiensis]
MNIWILNHYALKPNEAGGTRHYDIAHELVKKGHRVRIIASSFVHYTFRFRSNKKFFSEEVNGVLFDWIWTFPYNGNSIGRMINMITYCFVAIVVGGMRKEKPDAIVGSSVHLFACLAAYVLSRWKKATFVVEVRDLWPRTLIDMGAITEKSLLARLFFFIEAFVYKRADRIITLLPGAVDYIVSKGGTREKTVYIPNGVAGTQALSQANNPLCQKLKEIRKKHKNIAMYAGAHGHANALEVVVESARLLSEEEVAYVFIGNGPEKEKLVRLASDIHHCYFFDPVPKASIAAVLSEADVLIVSMRKSPIYQYGISLNKLFDYLLVGKPVLFAGEVYNDIVQEAAAGITVPPEDAEQMAHGLRTLLQLEEQEKGRIKQRSTRYIEHYRIDKIANRFLEACRADVSREKRKRW